MILHYIALDLFCFPASSPHVRISASLHLCVCRCRVSYKGGHLRLLRKLEGPIEHGDGPEGSVVTILRRPPSDAASFKLSAGQIRSGPIVLYILQRDARR